MSSIVQSSRIRSGTSLVCRYMSFLSENVPPNGLRLIPNFVPKNKQNDFYQFSLYLDKMLTEQVKTAPREKATTYLSKQHNISSSEYYKRLKFQFHDQTLLVQHFERYGEDGHQLTYFIDNQNIPFIVQRDLISVLEGIPEVQALKAEKEKCNKDLHWNFTFNTYRKSATEVDTVPGFPFHMDIPSNGEITFIYPLLSSATLQMKRSVKDVTTGYEIPNASEVSFQDTIQPGSLLMFSGESRWKWLHSILPQSANEVKEGNQGGVFILDKNSDIYRISLVLGCY